MINLNDLTVGYKGKELIKAVKNINLNNGLYCLAGANGSGKTSLLKTISGLNKLQSGQILIENKSINEWSKSELAKKIGFLFSSRPFAPYLSAIQVILTGFYPFLGPYESPKDIEIAKALEMLKMLDASHLINTKFSYLSDGQKQKVMLARALAPDYSIVLLDEPLNFLDIPSKRMVLDVLFNLSSKSNKLILFTQHELFEKMSLVDNWLFINKRRQLYATKDSEMNSEKFENFMFS